MVWRLRPRHVTRVLTLAAVLIGAYAGILRATGNFHTVVAHQLYRSAQPTGRELRQYISDYGIKTVINLRGPNPRSAWYREELAVTKEMDVTHIDFGMSSRRILVPAEAKKIIAIMRAARKPILIHCEGGADRSGLISALYVSEIAGKGEQDAEDQLSVLYGHLAIPYLVPAYAMDESWERLEKTFGIKNS